MQLVRMVLVLLLFSLPVLAEGPEPRLAGPISDANRVVLPHSRTPRVLAGQDLGPVAADMRIPGITLVFRRSAAQEAARQQGHNPGDDYPHRRLRRQADMVVCSYRYVDDEYHRLL